MRLSSYSGAGVMLFRYNTEAGRYEVLLGKRAIPRGYGQWAIIGGEKNHRDSDYYDCALREFREETRVDLDSIQTRMLAVRKIDIPFFHWRTHLILALGPLPEFKVNSENSELRWFPLDEVKDQDLWLNLDRELGMFRHLIRGSEKSFAEETT